eukprot:CAMPEP_0194281804 /NCGR_PEP_ID=MMETSP0169-20130528/21601_1 /TAXON_ID=218684 /ORGANISM="Corethron pennatum, Strain L29A3" /LENGTH=302 /DNA_ID=CAMNT_0039026967 /DNA_START=114 /DNA_END=1022 /DNA_ORIENTATION=-
MSDPERTTITLQGQECILHTWNASTSRPRGVCVIYHGFLAHSRYPTVSCAAELLCAANYMVLSADLPGHGASPGVRGYLSGTADLIGAGVVIAERAAESCTPTDGGTTPLPLFLVGSSMGGTIALAVAGELRRQPASRSVPALAGVVLLAPMLALDVAPALRHLLYGVACLPGLSSVPLIPSPATSGAAQYRDPDARRKCEKDPLCVDTGGKIMPASASTCVELANGVVGEQLSDVVVPFLCMVAKEDVVVKNRGSYRLMEEAESGDKTMKEYDALHGLLCEPEPLISIIKRDLLAWVNHRS